MACSLPAMLAENSEQVCTAGSSGCPGQADDAVAPVSLLQNGFILSEAAVHNGNGENKGADAKHSLQGNASSGKCPPQNEAFCWAWAIGTATPCKGCYHGEWCRTFCGTGCAKHKCPLCAPGYTYKVGVNGP